MEYYPVIKRTEVLIQAKTWINFKNSRLERSERGQPQRATYYMFHLYEMSMRQFGTCPGRGFGENGK